MTPEFDVISIVLRVLVYAGGIGCAGACLYKLCFPANASAVDGTLRCQMRAGVALLLVVEPIRYALFLYLMSGGDVSLAMSPDMIGMGLELPPGQASILRILGALTIGIAGLRYLPLGLIGAAAIICSYTLEGHTAAADYRGPLALLLVAHIAIGHWWLGALVPLAAATRNLSGDKLAESIERFGRLAILFVPVLLIAGLVMLILLVGLGIDPTNAYQQRFALKIVAVAGVLALAARNKLRLTPLLRAEPDVGAKRLRQSIYIEASLAFAILIATAVATAVSPDPAL